MALNTPKVKARAYRGEKEPVCIQFTQRFVTTRQYVSVYISANLNWTLHIQYVIDTANRTLG